MPENYWDKPPLYSVGEEVFLVSTSAPELNGEAVVLSVTSGITPRGRKTYGYQLTIAHPYYPAWAESALRKKPKPSEMSFNQLMHSLNTEVVNHA